ncbi:MAG: hypothetical protein C0616_05680 [Desulfuromonas sp.]|nr:MAG: hypothetical protein C0616_05680 [Desulfuromonas sp.]
MMETEEMQTDSHLFRQELTLHSIPAALDEMQMLMDDHNDLRIDLTNVKKIDTCGMQLLLATGHAAVQKGLAFHLVGTISKDIEDFISQAGFSEQFARMRDGYDSLTQPV